MIVAGLPPPNPDTTTVGRAGPPCPAAAAIPTTDHEEPRTMKQIPLRGDSVPALGFGTWQLTGATCREAVADALAIGYRHLDTAEMYENEEQVGAGIADSGVPRDEIFLTSKVWWEHLGFDDAVAAAEASLRRLRTDHLDLLLIHWPNPDVGHEEPLRALATLQEQGKARHIGVSNFTPRMTAAARDMAPIECNQVEYHPFLSQDELLAICRKHGMMLTAYAPLAHGEVVEDATLTEIGERHGKSPTQVTLRWLIQQESVAAIPSSSDPDHRRENFDVCDFRLSDEEMDEISSLDRGERLIDPEFAPAWER